MRRAGAHLAVIGCAAALAGCGLGAGPAPSAVKLLVTSEFGSRTVGPHGPPLVHGQETVMSLLERNHHVTTRFGGGFVQSIEGLSGGTEGGRPVDWFYYVNGVEASKGAAATNVNPGDHIWWDHHDWSQTEDVPAVVGSFPEPFLNGISGKRLPVRVECVEASGPACHRVTEAMRRAGVLAAVSALGAGGGETLRVIVGAWARVRAEPSVATIEDGPRASGVYARVSRSGSNITVLDADGQQVRTLAAGAGLIAATRQGQEAPVWVVTGTDPAGVEAAARAFNPSSLEDRFAVAALGGQTIALPARTVAAGTASG
jgi:hypothetical protein